MIYTDNCRTDNFSVPAVAIRLYLPCTKRRSVWFKINRKMVKTIEFRFDLIRYPKYFSVCSQTEICSVSAAVLEGHIESPLKPLRTICAVMLERLIQGALIIASYGLFREVIELIVYRMLYTHRESDPESC